MDDSCSVCGAILAPLDSEYPEWCKSIRACKLYTNRSFEIETDIGCGVVCWVGSQPVLSGLGYNDEDAIPFFLPGVPRHSRFSTRSTLEDEEASCYPFHAACWDILEDIAPKDFLAIIINYDWAVYPPVSRR